MFIKQGNLTNEHACSWQRGQSGDRPHRSSSHHAAIAEVIKQLLFQRKALSEEMQGIALPERNATGKHPRCPEPLWNPLHPIPAQDGIHYDYSKEPWLTRTIFTNSGQKRSLLCCSITNTLLTNSAIQNKTPTLPKKEKKTNQPNRRVKRQLEHIMLWISRNSTKMNSY